MTLLNRLTKLIKQKEINKNILSKETGIPYTTIDSLYKKGYDNMKLSTLQKICDYFDVTLDYMVYGINESIQSEKERYLLRAYRAKPEMQDAVDRLLEIQKTSPLAPEETITYIAAYGAGTQDDEEDVDIP